MWHARLRHRDACGRACGPAAQGVRMLLNAKLTNREKSAPNLHTVRPGRHMWHCCCPSVMLHSRLPAACDQAGRICGPSTTRAAQAQRNHQRHGPRRTQVWHGKSGRYFYGTIHAAAHADMHRLTVHSQGLAV